MLATGLRMVAGHAGARAASGSPRILITGVGGQIGTELVVSLRETYGAENVVASDVRKATGEVLTGGKYVFLDVTDMDAMERIIVDNNIDWVVNMAGVLSGAAEKNPELAIRVNSHGLENAVMLAKRHNLRLLTPSSIAAFGPTTPRDDTPNQTVMEPTTIYGVAKLQAELMARWAREKHGVDCRTIRYPGLISHATAPGGGTTDWACHMPISALTTGKYRCFVRPDTRMPMMSMPDAIRGTLEYLEAPRTGLSTVAYNVQGCSFTPDEMADAIRKRVPGFEVTYEPDFRQSIADSWPRSLDDSVARADWDWKPEYDLDMIVDYMLDNLEKRLAADGALRTSAPL